MKDMDKELCKDSTVARRLLAFGFLVMVVTVAPLAAFGDGKGDVVVELKAQKVVAKSDGKEELVPADQAAPGETISYTAVYRNRGSAPVKGLEATLPIPAGMEYVAGSAQPAGARASTDGISFQPMPLEHKVKAADGTERKEPVPLASYRKLRWSVGELAPGASVTVSAKAKLSLPQP
jgi:uncharacterized repeat protein (TIGR01451 family)